MASVKTMRAKMADEGLTSYIVTYSDPDSTYIMQFWADDAAHAGEQFDDQEEWGAEIDLIETQDEFEARTGRTLDYGRQENL